MSEEQIKFTPPKEKEKVDQIREKNSKPDYSAEQVYENPGIAVASIPDQPDESGMRMAPPGRGVNIEMAESRMPQGREMAESSASNNIKEELPKSSAIDIEQALPETPREDAENSEEKQVDIQPENNELEENEIAKSFQTARTNDPIKPENQQIPESIEIAIENPAEFPIADDPVEVAQANRKKEFSVKDLQKKPLVDDRGIFSVNLWSTQKLKYWKDIKQFDYIDVEDVEIKKRRKNGYSAGRPCTDCGICCTFCVFLIIWILAYVSTMFVPFHVSMHFDGNGNYCNGDYPYIYFPELLGQTVRENYQNAVCVSNCAGAQIYDEEWVYAYYNPYGRYYSPIYFPDMKKTNCLSPVGAQTECPQIDIGAYYQNDEIQACLPYTEDYVYNRVYKTNVTKTQCDRAALSTAAYKNDNKPVCQYQSAQWLAAKYYWLPFFVQNGIPLIICILSSLVLNFLVVYCIGFCGRPMMYLTFILNILGLVLLSQGAPTERKNGFNIAIALIFSYLGYLTIKFLWGLITTCKHLNQGLQVISSTNEVFVAKRTLWFSVLHLILIMILALTSIASIWQLYTQNQFIQYYPKNNMEGEPISWNTEYNPLYYGEHTTKWTQVVTTFLAIQILVLVWIFKILTNQSKYIAMVSVSSYYFNTTKKEDGTASVCKGAQFAYINNYSSLVLEGFTTLLVDWIPSFLINATNQNPQTGLKGLIGKCANFLTCVQELYYIDDRGLAQMAITGDTFCTSAWTGFIVNLKHNEEQYFAINSALFIVDSYSLCILYLQLILWFVLTGIISAYSKHSWVINVQKMVGLDATPPSYLDNNQFFYNYLQGYTESQNFSYSIALMLLVTTVVSKHTIQLWKDAILTAFQCRAVDLEINACKKHKTHYTWKNGPKAFHDKIAEIKCDHQHAAGIEEEEERNRVSDVEGEKKVEEKEGDLIVDEEKEKDQIENENEEKAQDSGDELVDKEDKKNESDEESARSLNALQFKIKEKRPEVDHENFRLPINQSEIISLYIGKAGIQMGNSIEELMCLEHSIGLDGRYSGNQDDQYFTNIYQENRDGIYQPRSIMIDTESTYIEEAQTRYYWKNSKDYFADGTGLQNGIYSPYKHYGGDKLEDKAKELIRKKAEACDLLQGLQIFSSVQGRFSSQLTSLMSEYAQHQLGKQLVINYSICPSAEEPLGFDKIDTRYYNSLFGFKTLLENSDLNILMDYQSIQKANCQENFQNLQNQVLCSSGHQMTYMFTAPANYIGLSAKCNQCRDGIQYADGYYHCQVEGCNADYHPRCAKVSILDKVQCKNGHLMEFMKQSPYPGSGVRCSSCKKTQNCEEGFYHCPEGKCKIDYHQGCARIPQVESPINRVIALTAAHVTSFTRFKGESFTLQKLTQDLKSSPRISFMYPAFTTIATGPSQNVYTATNHIFSRGNMMLNTIPNISTLTDQGQILANQVIYRGPVSMEGIFSAKTNLPLKCQFQKQKPMFVPDGNILQNVTKSAVSIVSSTNMGLVMDNYLNEAQKSYRKREFVQQYLDNGMEEGEFSETFENIAALVKDYESEGFAFGPSPNQSEASPNESQYSGRRGSGNSRRGENQFRN